VIFPAFEVREHLVDSVELRPRDSDLTLPSAANAVASARFSWPPTMNPGTVMRFTGLTGTRSEAPRRHSSRVLRILEKTLALQHDRCTARI
jgi:hypothetical protein